MIHHHKFNINMMFFNIFLHKDAEHNVIPQEYLENANCDVTYKNRYNIVDDIKNKFYTIWHRFLRFYFFDSRTWTIITEDGKTIPVEKEGLLSFINTIPHIFCKYDIFIDFLTQYNYNNSITYHFFVCCFRADSDQRISQLQKENDLKSEQCMSLQTENKNLKFEKQVYRDIYEERPSLTGSKRNVLSPSNAKMQEAYMRRKVLGSASSIEPVRSTSEFNQFTSVFWKIENSDIILVRDRRALVGDNRMSRLFTGTRGKVRFHSFAQVQNSLQRRCDRYVFQINFVGEIIGWISTCQSKNSLRRAKCIFFQDRRRQHTTPVNGEKGL